MSLPKDAGEAASLPTAKPPAYRRSTMLGLLVVVAVALLFCLPFLHAVYWLGDEGILLRGAAVLASGGRIYTDFFAFYPPAGYLIMESWLKLFGPSFIGVRLFAILMIMAIAGFSYLACLLASDSMFLSAFLALAWLATAKTTWIVGISHHWLTTMFSMAAFWVTLHAIGGRGDKACTTLPGVAGLIAGTAAMVTSSCGLWTTLATAASFDTRKFRREFITCLAGCLAMPLLCLGYIVLNGEFVAAYDGIVRFTLTQYAGIQKEPFGNGLPWYYPNLYLFPAAGLLTVVMLLRNVRTPVFRVCAIYALAGLLGTYPRPDLVHINFTAPLALPLLAYGAMQLTAHWRAGDRRVLFALGVLWCLPGTVGFIHQGLKAICAPVVTTPVGSVSLLGNEKHGGGEVFNFLATLPGNAQIFFYPYMPLLPYLTDRQQVSRFDIFIPDYTPPAQYYEACVATARQAKWVVLDRAEMSPEHWLIVFPAMGNPRRSETVAFEQAIESNFALVRRMGVFEVRQRTTEASEMVCNAILQ